MATDKSKATAAKAKAKKTPAKSSARNSSPVLKAPTKNKKGKKPFLNNSQEHLQEVMRERLQEYQEKRGRPSVYSEELGVEICVRIAQGESLNSICREDYMPGKSTVVRWAMFHDDPIHFPNEELRERLGIFSAHYKHAREIQAENLIDEITDISDDGSNDFMEKKMRNGETMEVFNSENVHRSKLRTETRRWLGEVYLPKVQAMKKSHMEISTKQPIVLQFDKQDEDA